MGRSGHGGEGRSCQSVPAMPLGPSDVRQHMPPRFHCTHTEALFVFFFNLSHKSRHILCHRAGRTGLVASVMANRLGIGGSACGDAIYPFLCSTSPRRVCTSRSRPSQATLDARRAAREGARRWSAVRAGAGGRGAGEPRRGCGERAMAALRFGLGASAARRRRAATSIGATPHRAGRGSRWREHSSKGNRALSLRLA